MTINPKFKIGQSVYLKTDEDQKLRIVTGLLIRPNTVLYRVSFRVEETDHYDFELTEEKDLLKKFDA